MKTRTPVNVYYIKMNYLLAGVSFVRVCFLVDVFVSAEKSEMNTCEVILHLSISYVLY